jgi:membrane protease YdiL (CAAX protease family)
MNLINDLKFIFVKPNSINIQNPTRNIKNILFYILILYFIQISKTFLVAWVDFVFGSTSHIKSTESLSFFRMAFIVPIYEELAFRLFLRPKKINFLISFVTILLVLLETNLFITDFWFYVFIIILLIVAVKFDCQQGNDVKSNLILIYASSLFFGMLHLFNFDILGNFDIIVMVYIISKIISGFLFSLIRLKFGITTSIILHILINSTGYILMLLSKN